MGILEDYDSFESVPPKFIKSLAVLKHKYYIFFGDCLLQNMQTSSDNSVFLPNLPYVSPRCPVRNILCRVEIFLFKVISLSFDLCLPLLTWDLWVKRFAQSWLFTLPRWSKLNRIGICLCVLSHSVYPHYKILCSPSEFLEKKSLHVFFGRITICVLSKLLVKRQYP